MFMSLNTYFVLSNEYKENDIDLFRNVYGISFMKMSGSHKINIGNEMCEVFMLNDSLENGFFWDEWSPISKKEYLKICENKKKLTAFEEVVFQWKIDFDKRYISFEACLYIILLKYLKRICKIKKVGLFIYEFENVGKENKPIDEKNIILDELTPEVLYNMKENTVYYVE